MRKYHCLVSLLIISAAILHSCKKDTVPVSTITFESLRMPVAGYWNGSDQAGFYNSGKLRFDNQFNASWQTWSGFAYSQKNDVKTQGYENQYSVADPGNGTNKFALFYPSFDGPVYTSFPENEEYLIESVDLCNSTYAALSMKNGDAYCKKFGGASGNDSDWFKVIISGFDKNGTKTGTIEYYLADFRFADGSKDYILNEWRPVDLSALGKVNRLTFEFASSDSGKYGINTPTYLCLDNFRYEE